MANERMMRKQVVEALRSLDAISIENGVGLGTPDVNYADGWLELKDVDAWPAHPETPLALPHFTPQQRVWHLKRARAGGESYVLLKVGEDWALLDGRWAAQYLGKSTKEVIMTHAVRWWPFQLDGEGLCACLRRT